jgi:hypothetical protein
LQYFDFSQNTIRKIQAQAFQGCSNLKLTEFSSELRYIGNAAFNMALKADEGGTLYIPSKVGVIYGGAFNVTTLPVGGSNGGFKLQIGTAEHPSVLKLNKPSTTSDQKSKFLHEKGWTSIWIYHKTYKSAADIAKAVGEDANTVLVTIFGPGANAVASFA